MKLIFLAAFCFTLAFLFFGCSPEENNSSQPSVSPVEVTPTPTPTPTPILIPDGATLRERFNAPDGYARIGLAEDSFGSFLRDMPLKPDGSSAYLFDGTAVLGLNPAAVINWEIGVQDRCRNTNALIKMRAEYLYSMERYDDIAFHFMSGFNFTFSKWSEGYTVKVDGSKADWVESGDPNSSRDSFDKYLNFLYAYTNATAILADLQASSDPSPGDVFAEGGGVIIADIAKNPDTGEIAVILCKGGNPAQSLYIIGNTEEPGISPWFTVSEGGVVYTDSGSFVMGALKCFK